MSKGLFQLLPLIIICLVSCNKVETPPQNSDTPTSGEQLLKTGTTENMLLITYDSVARACDKYLESFTLDLNNDNVDDLKISGIMPVYYTTDYFS